jgi:hypothetical protein
MEGGVMRCFAIIAVCVLALAGCKKKPAPAPAEPEPAPGLKKDGLPTEGPAPSGGGGGSGIIAAGGGIGVVNPVQALGGGGGGGAVMAVRKAARRASALNDMKTLGELIELMRDDVGRMPTKDAILRQLKDQSPALFAACTTEGSIILTGTTEGGGLWAFEVDANLTPGIALIGGRATRTTPDDLKPYLDALPRSLVQPPAPQPAPMGKIENKQPAPPQPQPQPGAAALPVGQKDMEDVRLFIDTFSGASGQMPTPQQVSAALQQSGSPAAALVEKRAITLTGARTREGVWAYEAAAVQRGGLVASANGTETLTAAELRRRLGR